MIQQNRHLGIRKLIIPRHVRLQSSACRFNWVFKKGCYKRIAIVRLFEAHIVDHFIVVDSRLSPNLTNDSSEFYPMVLYSSARFHCIDPRAEEVRIVDLHEVLRY